MAGAIEKGDLNGRTKEGIPIRTPVVIVNLYQLDAFDAVRFDELALEISTIEEPDELDNLKKDKPLLYELKYIVFDQRMHCFPEEYAHSDVAEVMGKKVKGMIQGAAAITGKYNNGSWRRRIWGDSSTLDNDHILTITESEQFKMGFLQPRMFKWFDFFKSIST